MAKKKQETVSPSKGTRGTKVPYQNVKYVLNNLSDDELSACDAMSFDVERAFEYFEVLIDSGFSVKHAYDTYSNCYVVTATCEFEGFDESGLAVSARSDILQDAVKILWFKRDIVCGGDLRTMDKPQEKKGRRG